MTYYEWREGSKHKVSAQVAGEVCAGLEQDGRLTAKDLVEVSNVRAFFTLKRDEPQYESIQIILNDEEKYNELMKVAVRELMALEKKYAKIKELGKLFDEINSLVQITFPELAMK